MKNYDPQQLKDSATDRMDDILVQVCGVPIECLDGRPRHPCPKCGGKDRFRVFRDGTGGVICNQCHSEKNGDILSSIMWVRECSFPQALQLLAEFLGVAPSTDRPEERDIIEAVCRAKLMPREAFEKFGVVAAMRGRKPVARVNVYNSKGEVFSYFDLAPDTKGWFKEGKGNAGMFFPGRLPQPGESWLIVEGPKDAAALVGLGYLAAGMPGAEMPARFARLFRGVNVTLVPDRDQKSLNGAEKTALRLAGIAA